ncbi:MAG TPA: D-erythronate dehydrogenase [Gammaproteobacteria bacterium]|nr:D-erythronate dehydrogenase [Gammaproteobacteria bacterium]
MRVLITGGTGFLGTGLARALLERGQLTGPSGSAEPIDELVAFDQAEPANPLKGVEYVSGDIAAGPELEDLFADGFDSVFHLAAVVSGAAEADFDLGMRVNLDGTRRLLELMRSQERRPRVVFSSSVAVFGGDMPPVIRDDTATAPQSSYGTQKAMAELLLVDASRRGFLDTRCLRLPTIVVRPGKPNKAASSFASSIIREPLSGRTTVCPVPDDTQVWQLSPRKAVAAFVHAHELAPSAWGTNRVLNLPGITATVREMVAALERAGGDANLVRWEIDPDIARIVATWPGQFNAERARGMGFESDDSIDAIVRAYRDDYLRADSLR